MKFGKTFSSHQVPEWSHSYMRYKDLKKQIKSIVLIQQKLIAEQSDSENNSSDDHLLNDKDVKSLLAKFFFSLDRNIEKVDDFFNKQFSEYDRRLKRLMSTLGNSPEESQMDDEEIDEVIGILLELRNSFRNLKWFGELNKRGFTKILKKLDKKTGTNQQQSYLNARVNALPFANESDILKCLNLINSYLNKWGPRIVDVVDDASSSNNNNSPNTNASNNNSSVSPSLQATQQQAALNASTIDSVMLNKGHNDSNISSISTSNNNNNNNNKNEKYGVSIANDDAKQLIDDLIGEYRSPVLAPLRLLISLLNKAALAKSYKIIDALLEVIPVMGDNTDISGRNFFHHHVIALGKQFAKKRESEKDNRNITNTYNTIAPATPPDVNPRLLTAFGSDGINSNDSPNGLYYIFENLPPHLKFGILQKDNYRRTPLHYASQYGLKDVTSIIIEYLKKWNLWNENISIDDVNVWGDSELLTPLHLSVLGSHPKTTEVLIKAMENPQLRLSSPRLFLIAARLNNPALMKLLLSCNGIDIDYLDPDSHETALYTSCKLNLVESLKFLLDNGANTEIGEQSFGWTPIFVAASEGFMEVAQLLISHGANYQVSDESGWSPMEHAALRGQLEMAKLLTPKGYDASKVLSDPYTFFPPIPSSLSFNNNNNNNNSNTSTKSTPELLPLPNGKMYSQPSTSSVDRLPQQQPNSQNQNNNLSRDSSRLFKSLKNGGAHNSQHSKRSNSPPDPVKSFGHRYLNPSESLILITLGTTDLRDGKSPITLNRVPLSKAYSTELDTALSLVVSAKNYDDPPVVLDLPLDDTHGSATDPISFRCIDGNPMDATIYFDIVPTYAYGEAINRGSDDHYHNHNHNHQQNGNTRRNLINRESSSSGNNKVVGRAVALLNTAYTDVGKNRRSLSNVITAPILESETLEVLGTIRFEFMLVTPFTHEKMTLGRTETYWKSLVSTRVIGHRGLGKNNNDRKSLQLGENTVESFIAAASLGASYVEFDVQLTKDHIPVVYHDFLVAESGMDIPMHEMTAEQFLALNKRGVHRPYDFDETTNNTSAATDSASINGFGNGSGGGGPANGVKAFDDEILHTKYRRSKSVSHQLFDHNHHNDYNDQFFGEDNGNNSRMKFTKTWKTKGFKGNSRGHSIASSFATLTELFKKVPKNIGFNIECKYPMLDEAQNEDIGEIAINMNHWVDTVLKVVYDHSDGRDIMFSSFHPDICVLLSLKQPSIPILYLTEAGTAEMADIRASSLQAAIRFAKKWNLLGIVAAAEPLIHCPRLTGVVKSSGLVCVTYGVLNNVPDNANLQMLAGVDAVIVDSVLAVRKGLRKEGDLVPVPGSVSTTTAGTTTAGTTATTATTSPLSETTTNTIPSSTTSLNNLTLSDSSGTTTTKQKDK